MIRILDPAYLSVLVSISTYIENPPLIHSPPMTYQQEIYYYTQIIVDGVNINCLLLLLFLKNNQETDTNTSKMTCHLSAHQDGMKR